MGIDVICIRQSYHGRVQSFSKRLKGSRRNGGHADTLQTDAQGPVLFYATNIHHCQNYSTKTFVTGVKNMVIYLA